LKIQSFWICRTEQQRLLVLEFNCETYIKSGLGENAHSRRDIQMSPKVKFQYSDKMLKAHWDKLR